MKTSIHTSAGRLALAATLSLLASTAPAKEPPAMKTDSVWDKTFPRDTNVSHRKISFRNRYGIELVGDLYQPKGKGTRPLPALVLSGPFGAVKEQSSGLYAQILARRGYVALAFDPSFTGESGGQPRDVASPDINTEDFSAAVDAVGLLPEVDRERIGLVGICGFGGMGLNAAAVDKRIKAVVTTSLYDMSRVMSRGYNDSRTLAERTAMLESMSRQRWSDAAQGAPTPGPRNLPETLEGIDNPVVRMYFGYYRTSRGFHPRSVNSNGAWTATTPFPFMNFPLVTYAQEISPRPILLIAGEKAHSRYFSEDIYKAAAEPKELLIIPGANHVDLYDDTTKIPFARIDAFFRKNLAAKRAD